MAENNTSYGNIFKTTFLFGFVQVFRAIISIIKNKIAAVLIGAEGIGILGIFNTTIQMIQTGAGLGVNQSAVRDISEANASGNFYRFSKIISVTNKVILYTGLLGCFITLGLSHWLSEWTFGNNTYNIGYCILSFVVAFNIINECKQAILKGMRQLKSLAYASIIGSIIGLFIAIPLYYFFGKNGIVPELLIASIIAVLVSDHYVKKIEYKHTSLTRKEIVKEAKPMVKMGIALMIVTFLQTIVAFIINAFIRSKGGLDDVGYFSAANTITSGYFGVIVSALMTDYYPRIAAVNHDNDLLQEELNRQSIVSLLLCSPMFVLFMTLLPLFIETLYTVDFLPAINVIKWSIYWTLITVCSNQVDMILVAKFQTRIFLTISVIFRLVQLILCLSLYSLIGLEGLGVSYLILGILHMTIMCTTVYCLYGIKFNSAFLKIALVVASFALSASIIQNLTKGYIYYLLSFLLFISSLIFSYIVVTRYMNLDIVGAIKKIINKK